MKFKNKWIKITSISRNSSDFENLIGKVHLAEYISHEGNGLYRLQIRYENKYYLPSDVRIKFISKEEHPEYYL